MGWSNCGTDSRGRPIGYAFGNNWTIELRGNNSSMEDQYVCQEHESELFVRRG